MNKLQQYSAFAIAMLTGKYGESQIIYTDVDDIHISADPWVADSISIDLDMDGNADFAFRHYLYTNWTYETFGEYFYNRQTLLFELLPLNPLNGAMGSNGLTLPNPYFLDSGELVDASQIFQYHEQQILAEGDYNTNNHMWHSTEGNWGVDEDYGFLGLRFIDSASCMHYAWLRLNIDTAYRAYSIADWAYNSNCNKGILTFSTLSDTTVEVANIPNPGCTITSDASNIYIQSSAIGLNNIYIYSISGSILKKIESQERLVTISRSDLPKGIYLLQVVGVDLMVSKEIGLF